MGVEGKQLQKGIRRLWRETDDIDCSNGFTQAPESPWHWAKVSLRLLSYSWLPLSFMTWSMVSVTCSFDLGGIWGSLESWTRTYLEVILHAWFQINLLLLKWEIDCLLLFDILKEIVTSVDGVGILLHVCIDDMKPDLHFSWAHIWPNEPTG